MFIYLLIISMICTQALHLDVEKILLQSKCTIPIVNSTDNVSWDKPFIVRNKNYSNTAVKNEMSIHNLIHKYGDTTVGIDFPGSFAAPTDAWRGIKLRDYVKRYVLHNKSYEEYVKSDAAILWGPSDSCEFTGGCPKCGNEICRYVQKIVPTNISDTFVCYGKEDRDNMHFGLAGKFGGLNFHRHLEIYNQLLYGKKLWYFIDRDYSIQFNNLTSAETVYNMLVREIYPPHDACIQEAGDFIYIPNEVWHMTFNFDTVFMAGCIYDPEPYIPQ